MASRAQRHFPVAVQPRRVADLRMLLRRAVTPPASDPREKLAGLGALRAVALQTLGRNGPVEVDLSVLVAGAVDPVAGEREERDGQLVQDPAFPIEVLCPRRPEPITRSKRSV